MHAHFSPPWQPILLPRCSGLHGEERESPCAGEVLRLSRRSQSRAPAAMRAAAGVLRRSLRLSNRDPAGKPGSHSCGCGGRLAGKPSITANRSVSHHSHGLLPLGPPTPARTHMAAHWHTDSGKPFLECRTNGNSALCRSPAGGGKRTSRVPSVCETCQRREQWAGGGPGLWPRPKRDEEGVACPEEEEGQVTSSAGGHR